MWYADTQGLDKVLADIERFFEESGDDVWKPSELLQKLVAEGNNFASLDS
jgi:3-hydroxyacyl-CoA dehydrogenase